MIYLIIGIAVLILLVGFIFTESNAAYLLSDYIHQRADADFSAEVQHFRNFHISLALSFGIFGAVIHNFFDENTTGTFIVAYPVLGYVWFIISLRKAREATLTSYMMVSIVGLIIALFLAGGVYYRGLSPNNFKLKKDEFVVTGVYGLRMNYDDIVGLSITDTLPPVRKKLHGYVQGDILKGEFRLESGHRAKIAVDKRLAPFVKITAVDGRLFYITDGDIPSSEIVENLKSAMDQK